MQDDEIQDEWYDKDGNRSDTGAYDAGGHYYFERDSLSIDHYVDNKKYLES